MKRVLFLVVVVFVLCVAASCDDNTPTPTPFQGTVNTAVPFIVVTSRHGEGFCKELIVTPSGTGVVPPTELKPTKTPGPIMVILPDETRGPGWTIQVTATPATP